ncbi:hypothetical protein FHX49_000494 [Microbacterium endophyticum]|uniref:Uncharacterized protein n=1 Tax=Microbacterium endophyticum TaxID=1526412 RepID=A0A7W4V154_9MICO|nr:hypothetical protein [Microbacterium endophyticum]NIK37250.1 hypothetical protein [Microbacterium endophyticum]
MPIRMVELAHVTAMLNGRCDSASIHALALSDSLPQDQLVPCGIQAAASTGDTFRVKYGRARDLGATVLGLEEVLAALASLGPAPVAMCLLGGDIGTLLSSSAMKRSRM